MFVKVSCLVGTIIALLCVCSYAQEPQLLSDVCLGCICEVTSGCNNTIGCYGNVCGPFGITWGYWSDAGRLTINDEPSSNEGAYSRCANDLQCSSRTIQRYMAKFSSDCTGNGVIDCDDYLRIHRLGAYGCTGTLSALYETRYKLCMQAFAAYNV
ncbi:lysozyme [Linepithema humile]|uniref:lysozyme n=1 Tax=Linepithema humile TaxID=83485 RepID=UPI000623B2E8|nr:PREDICTED: lysozyme-like [Linepithema humile]